MSLLQPGGAFWISLLRKGCQQTWFPQPARPRSKQGADIPLKAMMRKLILSKAHPSNFITFSAEYTCSMTRKIIEFKVPFKSFLCTVHSGASCHVAFSSSAFITYTSVTQTKIEFGTKDNVHVRRHSDVWVVISADVKKTFQIFKKYCITLNGNSPFFQ